MGKRERETKIPQARNKGGGGMIKYGDNMLQIIVTMTHNIYRSAQGKYSYVWNTLCSVSVQWRLPAARCVHSKIYKPGK
jgi:hypothetical protein